MNNIYDDSENNNAPDYENNLAFDPTSADDLNEQGRQSEVLVAALEKCEKLEKQLKIAVEVLTDYARDDWWDDAVNDFDDEYVKGAFENDGYKRAQKALEQIKELDK